MKIEPINYAAAASAGTGHLSYRRDIDGMRAIAVLGVPTSTKKKWTNLSAPCPR